MNPQIKFTPDRVTTSGPNIDGGYKITLHIGEYQRQEVAELIAQDPELIKEWEVNIPKEE